MIRLQDCTPNVYYNQSRDFQLIGRLYDLVINSVKTNADMIYDLPSCDSAGTRLIDLLALTLGFQSKHDYNVKQLASMCSTFALILRNKGNQKSIEYAIQALLNAEGVTDSFDTILEDDNKHITIKVPQSLSDINLLKDILVYILPAGMSCSIVRTTTKKAQAQTIICTNDTVRISKGYPDYSVSHIINSVSGKIGMYTGEANPTNPKEGFIANSTIIQANPMPEQKKTNTEGGST